MRHVVRANIVRKHWLLACAFCRSVWGLLGDAHRGEFQIVAFWSLDRLTRAGPDDAADILGRIAASGTDFVSLREEAINSMGPWKRILIDLLAIVANFEAEAAAYDDGQLRIEPRTLRVYVRGQEVKLAKKELELLWMLVRNRPAVVSRERILSEVWQMADDVETRTVDAHIRNLRKKIGKDRIRTVIGYGYRFE